MARAGAAGDPAKVNDYMQQVRGELLQRLGPSQLPEQIRRPKSEQAHGHFLEWVYDR
jgi:hypothetical protein